MRKHRRRNYARRKDRAQQRYLDFGVGAHDGKVVLKFSTAIKWVDMTPDVAIRYAEAIINAALHAQADQLNQSKIIKPSLPGLPS